MSGAVIAVVVAAGLMGGGTAYLVWSLILPLLRPERAFVHQSATALTPTGMDSAAVSPVTDPDLKAQITAIRTDMTELARAQISMLEGMAERESQLLSEMRAVASARDPELLKSLQRIEALLTGEPAPEGGIVLKDEEDESPPDESVDFQEIGRV